MIKCEVTAHYADLGEKKDKDGSVLYVRLNKVSWCGSKPMWDLRAWTADGKPMKGMTLTEPMLQKLKETLDKVL